MALSALPQSAQSATPGLRLSPYAVAKPAMASNVRPALVLADRETRELLQAARAADVSNGGRFSAGPAGIQVWSGPFDGPNGTHGSAVHLGSVDWIYDTPVRHYATVYRTMVTAEGVSAGETTESVLMAVLNLTGISAEGTRLEMATPPKTDPFRSGR